MNLLHQALQPPWIVAGCLLLLPLVLRALHAVRGGFLPRPAAQHAWLAGAVAVGLLGLLRFGAGGGLDCGMLGVGLYAVMFGRERALLGLLVALALRYALGHGVWANFGVEGLVWAAWPAAVADFLQRRLERHLPRNLFIFILGNGMFVALVTTVATSLALLAAALACDAVPPGATLEPFFGAMLLLAWGESIVSGMLFSALVIFLPAAVPTYRVEDYLPPPRQD